MDNKVGHEMPPLFEIVEHDSIWTGIELRMLQIIDVHTEVLVIKYNRLEK